MGPELVPFFFFGCWGISALIGLAFLVLWIWMLVDCAMNEPSESSEKLIWILIILFANGLGGLLYLIIRRPERIRTYGK